LQFLSTAVLENAAGPYPADKYPQNAGGILLVQAETL